MVGSHRRGAEPEPAAEFEEPEAGQAKQSAHALVVGLRAAVDALAVQVLTVL